MMHKGFRFCCLNCEFRIANCIIQVCPTLLHFASTSTSSSNSISSHSLSFVCFLNWIHKSQFNSFFFPFLQNIRIFQPKMDGFVVLGLWEMIFPSLAFFSFPFDLWWLREFIYLIDLEREFHSLVGGYLKVIY